MAVNLIKSAIKDLSPIKELLKQNNYHIRILDKEFFLAYDNSTFVGILG